MMSQLQNVGAKSQAAVRHSFFGECFRVTAHDKGIGSKADTDSHGEIVQISCGLSLLHYIIGRGKYGKRSFSQLVYCSGNRLGDLQLFIKQGIQYILISTGGVRGVGHNDSSDGKSLDNVIQSADMVLVRMGADYIRKAADPQGFQILRYLAPAFIGAGIHEHAFLPRLDENGISLADIDEMHFQNTGNIRVPSGTVSGGSRAGIRGKCLGASCCKKKQGA